MAHVSIGHIEAAIKKVDTLDENAIDHLTETQTTAQPVLLGYIMSSVEEYQNEELANLLIYYFTVVLESFHQAGLFPETVTDELIDDFEEDYFALLDEYFQNEDEGVLEDFADQPDLVRFMAMEVGSEDDEGTSLSDETATQLFIVMLAMISLLSRSLPSKS